MRLYLVTASRSEWDDFDSAVVLADNESDACDIVHAELAKPWAERAAGTWFPLAPGAELSAEPIEYRRGPVMGFGVAG